MLFRKLFECFLIFYWGTIFIIFLLGSLLGQIMFPGTLDFHGLTPGIVIVVYGRALSWSTGKFALRWEALFVSTACCTQDADCQCHFLADRQALASNAVC